MYFLRGLVGILLDETDNPLNGEYPTRSYAWGTLSSSVDKGSGLLLFAGLKGVIAELLPCRIKP